jgi:alpha-D-xyloside xylohydrolase
VAPGVWKASVGEPQVFDLLKAAGVPPRLDALKKLGEQPFPAAMADCAAEEKDGQVYLRFPLEETEQLYGLGLNFKGVDQRGHVLNLHVDHFGSSDNGRTHAPVPFYVSDRGYGVFVNSAQYIRVYAGTGVRKDSPHPPQAYDRNTDPKWVSQPVTDGVEMLVPANGTEIYVFAGPTAMEAVQRFNLYCGGGVLPPKWGLGFTQRLPTLSNEADVRKEADSFALHGFPVDFFGLEPGWQSKSYPCTFEWDKGRFPDPARFTREMLDRGIRLNLWLNPYLSPASSLYDSMKFLSGSHTVWNGLVPDFNLPAAVRLYRHLFETQHLDIGISGYKIDEIDGYDDWLWPDVARFPSGISGEQMRQVFGLECQRQTFSWFHSRNKRTYGLARGSNGGGSSFPYVLYDDYYDHRDFITALCSSSFIGVLWTPEVRVSSSAEEWLRRMQSVCFSPMAMINAWNDGTQPWTYPAVWEQVKAVAMLRMRLFPYLYTTFAQYYFEGKPPIRAMQLVAGFSGTGSQNVSDQFMLGDNLLVAPLFTGEQKRKVYLPKGKWYDFYTGRLVGDGGVIESQSDSDHIPLYVRDGGIIPMIPPVLHTPSGNTPLPLELRCYGEKPASYALYDDDGVSFDYEKGDFRWYSLATSKDAKGAWQGRVAGKGPMGQYSSVSWRFMGVNH